MKEQVEKKEEAKFGGRSIFDVQIKKEIWECLMHLLLEHVHCSDLNKN
jgi:hypothetical protein